MQEISKHYFKLLLVIFQICILGICFAEEKHGSYLWLGELEFSGGQIQGVKHSKTTLDAGIDYGYKTSGYHFPSIIANPIRLGASFITNEESKRLKSCIFLGIGHEEIDIKTVKLRCRLGRTSDQEFYASTGIAAGILFIQFMADLDFFIGEKTQTGGFIGASWGW